MKAVAYVRVSREEEARCGVSLDAQTERIQVYCRLAGLQLVELIREEGESAGQALRDRPGGRRLLSLVEQGHVQHVVTTKLDRLFRDTVDALLAERDWREREVSLHLVDMGGQMLNTSTATGRMLYTIIASFAEFERGQISERTVAAMAIKRARGDRMGAPPMDDPEILARIYELHDAGQSYRGICAVLEREGHRPKRGATWHPETIRKILARRYAGVHKNAGSEQASA